MYKVKVRSDFSSAHNLRGYKGKCEELHGHNWHVEIEAGSDELNATGMVLDFSELRKILNGILAELDHKYLNEIEYFKNINPTSENIAKYIFDKVSGEKPGLKLVQVTVWETSSSAATYIPE